MTARQSPIEERLERYHDNAEDGHSRLRKDIEALSGRVSAVEQMYGAINSRMTTIERAPLNVEKVAFSTKQLLAIIGGVIVMGGGIWNLRVGINDLHTDFENSTRLQDERNQTQKDTMDQLRAAIEMRRVEIQRIADKLNEYMQQPTTARR